MLDEYCKFLNFDSLSPRLFRKCAQNAEELCQTEDWQKVVDRQDHRHVDVSYQPHGYVFSCLYRNMKKDKVGQENWKKQISELFFILWFYL